MSDLQKRDLGARSQYAISALEVALWSLSVSKILQAEELYGEGKLDEKQAYQILIGLLEARKLHGQLSAQAMEGIRAARRIEEVDQKAAAVIQSEKRAQIVGRNRFFRSKIGVEKPQS